MFDVAILGTGPAGLEAALTLKNRYKSFILFGDKNLSDNISKAHTITNYLGIGNKSGSDFQNMFLNHIKENNIEITNEYIKQIYDLSTHYALEDHSGNMYEAKSIIISTGVKLTGLIKDEAKYLGNGISYCATCDGALYRGKEIAIVLEDESLKDEVKFLESLASKVYLFSNLDIDSIKYKKIELKGNEFLEALNVDGNEYNIKGLFILRKSIPASSLVYGLEMNDNHIVVDRNMRTNLRGVFAAGDITGRPYQYIKAAGEGNIAALSASSFLDSLDK